MINPIVITYSDIISRCNMLSAFEAKEATAADGNLNFTDVRITEKDQVAIKAYIEEGISIIESRLSSILGFESAYTDNSTTWTLINEDTTRRKAGGFVKSTKEAIAAFTMSRWLENKKPDTAKAYVGMFKDLTDAALRIIAVKTKPIRPTA